MKRTCLFSAVLLMLCLSCDRQSVFEEFITIPDQTWNNQKYLHFNVNITDTVTRT